MHEIAHHIEILNELIAEHRDDENRQEFLDSLEIVLYYLFSLEIYSSKLALKKAKTDTERHFHPA